MDVFTDLLRDVRVNGAALGQAILSPPWSLRFVDGAPLTLCTLLRGEGWVVPARGEPHRLRPGDAAVARGPEPFLFTDDPAMADQPDRAEDVVCATSNCVSTPSSRTCGNAPEGATALLIGPYQIGGEVGERLLRALPPLLTVPADHESEAVLDYIAAEIAADRPGQQIVLDRLLDWMLVCTLRAWFDRPDATAPAWYRALAEPVVGDALHAMHDDPAHPWTVASLAAKVGVSRATLAKRFTESVGEPPLTYLTGWRMALAADLLADPHTTISAVARRVGYADGFGFSAAFKRVRGLTPSAYRRAIHQPRQSATVAD